MLKLIKRNYWQQGIQKNIIDKEEEYEVEEVQNHKKQRHNTQFLVHWKRYGNEHNQWIAETELPYIKEMIQDYWTKLLRQNL